MTNCSQWLRILKLNWTKRFESANFEYHCWHITKEYWHTKHRANHNKALYTVRRRQLSRHNIQRKIIRKVYRVLNSNFKCDICAAAGFVSALVYSRGKLTSKSRQDGNNAASTVDKPNHVLQISVSTSSLSSPCPLWPHLFLETICLLPSSFWCSLRSLLVGRLGWVRIPPHCLWFCLALLSSPLKLVSSHIVLTGWVSTGSHQYFARIRANGRSCNCFAHGHRQSGFHRINWGTFPR